MDRKTEELMKRHEERYEKEHNIFCPYCEAKQPEENNRDHVSYWGEDEDKECCCESCDKEFMVKEHVDRTFESKKIE